MKHKFRQSRRRMLKTSMLAVAGLAGIGSTVLPTARARAEDLPKLEEDDATAKALEYTHDATASSTRPNGDQFCNNCLYFKGSTSDAWARCDLFPGKVVSGPGWCNAWTAKG